MIDVGAGSELRRPTFSCESSLGNFKLSLKTGIDVILSQPAFSASTAIVEAKKNWTLKGGCCLDPTLSSGIINMNTIIFRVRSVTLTEAAFS